jgi:hypothetical protein
MKLLGIINVGFDVTDRLLIRSFAFVRKYCEYNETVHKLFIDLKETYDSIRKVVLHNILIEFRVPVELLKLIKMYLNGTHNKVLIGKLLSDEFVFENCLKQGDDLTALLLNFVLGYAIRKVQ